MCFGKAGIGVYSYVKWAGNGFISRMVAGIYDVVVQASSALPDIEIVLPYLTAVGCNGFGLAFSSRGPKAGAKKGKQNDKNGETS